jgi:hypothetical protein
MMLAGETGGEHPVDHLGELVRLLVAQLRGDRVVQPMQLLHHREGFLERAGERLLLGRRQLELLGELVEMGLRIGGVAVLDGGIGAVLNGGIVAVLNGGIGAVLNGTGVAVLGGPGVAVLDGGGVSFVLSLGGDVPGLHHPEGGRQHGGRHHHDRGAVRCLH